MNRTEAEITQMQADLVALASRLGHRPALQAAIKEADRILDKAYLLADDDYMAALALAHE